jgi:hypothetical protein
MQVATDKLDVAIGDASAGGTSALMPRLNELATDFSLTSRQLSRVLRILEESPQGLVFGAPAPCPVRANQDSIRPGSNKMRWLFTLFLCLLVSACFTTGKRG